MIDPNKIKVTDSGGDTVFMDVRSIHHMVAPSAGDSADIILTDTTTVTIPLESLQTIWDQWRGNVPESQSSSPSSPS